MGSFISIENIDKMSKIDSEIDSSYALVVSRYGSV